MTTEPRLTRVQRMLGRGFQCDPSPMQTSIQAPTRAPIWTEAEPPCPSAPGRDGVVVFLPTMVQRLDDRTRDRLAENVGAEVAALACDGVPVAVSVVVQYMPGADPAVAEGRRRDLAQKLAARIRAGGVRAGARVPVASTVMRGPGKVLSLNAMIAHAAGGAARSGADAPGAAILLDDDVEMEPGCLVALVGRYRRMRGPAAVGATKIGHAVRGGLSGLLYWAKSHTAPATQYPHACCMIVTMSVIENGFPPDLSSDDGFICFELLDPAAEDPLGRLKLEPDARVHHAIGGDGGAMYQRIRRMLLNHYQFLCAYDWARGKFYCRNLLFFGFWPVGRRVRQGTFRTRTIRWWLKAAYFTWFASIGLELAVRALIGRPIRTIPWGTTGGAGNLRETFETA